MTKYKRFVGCFGVSIFQVALVCLIAQNLENKIYHKNWIDFNKNGKKIFMKILGNQ